MSSSLSALAPPICLPSRIATRCSTIGNRFIFCCTEREFGHLCSFVQQETSLLQLYLFNSGNDVVVLLEEECKHGNMRPNTPSERMPTSFRWCRWPNAFNISSIGSLRRVLGNYRHYYCYRHLRLIRLRHRSCTSSARRTNPCCLPCYVPP